MATYRIGTYAKDTWSGSTTDWYRDVTAEERDAAVALETAKIGSIVAHGQLQIVSVAVRQLCEDCLEKVDASLCLSALDGEDVCEEHRDQRNDAAYESHLQDFYGGSR